MSNILHDIGQTTCCTSRKEPSRPNIHHTGVHELWAHRKHIIKDYLGHNGAHNLQQRTETVSTATSLPIVGAQRME